MQLKLIIHEFTAHDILCHDSAVEIALKPSKLALSLIT